MLTPKGLTAVTYSTGAFLDGSINDSAIRDSIGRPWIFRFEAANPSVTALLDEVGLKPSANSEATAARALSVFQDVEPLLECDLGLRASVERFVRAIHIIDSTGPGYDSSFSDPTLPFSIFISLPDERENACSLRVLEAIVHECMHLQLSCYEALDPIVNISARDVTWYSPWKKTRRKVQGILHGMYVFHVVSYLYETLIASRVLTETDSAFSHTRLSAIAGELAEVAGVEQCENLTATGVWLAKKLLVPPPECFSAV
jgi:HEXXH motif-containing protein